MGLDSKKGRPFGQLVGWAISRPRVPEGPSGRRMRSEAERARIAAESLLPVAQGRRWRKHGATHAGRFTIGDDAFDSETNRHRAKADDVVQQAAPEHIPSADLAGSPTVPPANVRTNRQYPGETPGYC